jgi:hypothetical protein
VLDAHEWFAWVVVLSNAFVGAWALAAHWLERLRVPALWRCTAAAEVTIFVQVGLGVAAQSSEDIEPPQMHTFYGFVAIIAVGLIYSYRQQVAAYRYLLYGAGGLFLMGLGIRAMVLA